MAGQPCDFVVLCVCRGC